MKIQKFNNEADWLEARRGRITGTALKDLYNKRDRQPKLGFYDLIAQRVAIPASEEGAMERGKRLEDEAVEKFAAKTGKKVLNDLTIWHRDDDVNIAISPDGYVERKVRKAGRMKVVVSQAVECKCLASAKHIQAWITNEIPEEYEAQKIQYFVVNDDLQTLYFLFYDPRVPNIELFWIEVKRREIQEQVDEYLALERDLLKRMELIEAKLTF